MSPLTRRVLLASTAIAAVGASLEVTPSVAAPSVPALGSFSPSTTMAEYDRMTGRVTSFQTFYVGRYDTVWPKPEGSRTGIYALYLDPVSMDAGTRYEWWASGAGDEWIDIYAERAAQVPGTVYVRPWAEMNADWQYSPSDLGSGSAADAGSWGDPSTFAAAWRRVVARMRTLYPNKFKFIFCPTTDTYQETIPVGRLWPGAGYVDYHGLDGFNWAVKYGGWRSFDNIYAAQWANLLRLSAKPIVICEVSSGEAPGRSKGQWWLDMFASLRTKRYRAVHAVCIFSIDKRLTPEATDWRVDSSQESLNGLRASLT